MFTKLSRRDPRRSRRLKAELNRSVSSAGQGTSRRAVAVEAAGAVGVVAAVGVPMVAGFAKNLRLHQSLQRIATPTRRCCDLYKYKKNQSVDHSGLPSLGVQGDSL